MTKIYRFRTVDQILGDFQELEKQTIYFASPEEFNDPLESSREMVWKHHQHEVWSLELDGFFHWFNHMDQITPSESLPGDPIALIQNINLQNAVQQKMKSQLIPYLAKADRNITRHELQYIFHCMYNTLFSTLNIAGNSFLDFDLQPYLATMDALESKGEASAIKDIVMRHGSHYTGFILNFKRHLYEQGRSKEMAEYFYLPEKYLDWREACIFPKYYVACFSSEYSDATMWAHYASSHTGVCLVFETTTNKGERYFSYSNEGPYSKYHLRKVKYQPEVDPINVLTDLEELKHFRSHIPVPDDARTWPQHYLETFRRVVVTKTRDWEREREYRLVWEYLQEDRGNLVGGIPQGERLMKYDFEQLKGIIFGAKMTDSDKIEIMKVINRKCFDSSRNEFQYFQAFLEDGRVKRFEIPNWLLQS